jgi:GTP-binding protein
MQSLFFRSSSGMGFFYRVRRDMSAPERENTAPDALDYVEKGRLLFAKEATFMRGVVDMDGLPPMETLEIAFAGRSNVGKSTLINALTGRKALARASHTPGRTQELNFFDLDGHLRFVDMPGYGYAAAPEAKVKAWTKLIKTYLRGRANLARVYLLVDSRHGLKDVDTAILNMLDTAAVSYQILLTKTDALKKNELEQRMAQTQTQLLKRPAAFPDIIATSSRDALGVPELRAAIAKLLDERVKV